MKLSIPDRMILQSIIPSNSVGSLDKLKIIKHMRDELAFSDREVSQYEIELNETGEFFTNDQSSTLEFDFGDIGFGMLLDSFKALDKEEKLQMYHVTLYERLLNEEE